MNHDVDHNQVLGICAIIAVIALIYRLRRWRPSTTAFGTARWMTRNIAEAAGMFAGQGLVFARSIGGKLLWLPPSRYCHVLLVGGTGAGKGVGIIIPILLSYKRGAVVCFDMKSDLYQITARRRGGRIIRLAPFDGGKDRFNPLDTIPPGSPMLIDSAKALAEALVVRKGTEHDEHWNDKAVQVITAVLVLVLLRFNGRERSLNSVQEIVSDQEILAAAGAELRQMGGLPARLGHQLKTLFEPGQTVALTKEGASVLSTVSRHLSFLDSDLVAESVATSTFDVAELRNPGTMLYLTIGPDQLEAQKNLLRCWFSTFVRSVGVVGDGSEVLFLCDEASALQGLPSLEEVLVRGRSGGARVLLAYQSDAQVQAAFKDKPTLIYDNCTVHLYLGASSIESADRLSRSLGEWTQVVEGLNTNESSSWQHSFGQSSSQSQQSGRGSSLNYSVNGRALLRPDEILTLDDSYIIALLRGMAPVLARRLKYYSDPAFSRGFQMRRKAGWWLLMAAAIGLIVWSLSGIISSSNPR